MSSGGGAFVTATICGFDRVATACEGLATNILKWYEKKIYMIPQATIMFLSCVGAVIWLNLTKPQALVAASIDVSNQGLNVDLRATLRVLCISLSVRANTTLVMLLLSPFSMFSASSSSFSSENKIQTSSECVRTTFNISGLIPQTSTSVEDILSSICTAKWCKTPKTTRTRAFPSRACRVIVSTIRYFG